MLTVDSKCIDRTIWDILWIWWWFSLCMWSRFPGLSCRRLWRMWCSCPVVLHSLPASSLRVAGWALAGRPTATHNEEQKSTARVNHGSFLTRAMAYLNPRHPISANPGVNITWLIQPRQVRLPVIWNDALMIIHKVSVWMKAKFRMSDRGNIRLHHANFQHEKQIICFTATRKKGWGPTPFVGFNERDHYSGGEIVKLGAMWNKRIKRQTCLPRKSDAVIWESSILPDFIPRGKEHSVMLEWEFQH